jgi:hypothetical protein
MSSFNAIDSSSVDAAEQSGLSKAREISEALIRILANELEKMDEAKIKPAVGEDASDIDPNISNERHDIYQKLSEEYQNSGADPETAKAAAFDYAILDLGAEESENISAAHDQITGKAQNLTSSNEDQPLSFMQTMTAAGIDASEAVAINKLYADSCAHAENVMDNKYDGAPNDIQDQFLSGVYEKIKDPDLSTVLLERHNSDIKTIYMGNGSDQFKPELFTENHQERLTGLGLSSREAVSLTAIRDKEIADTLNMGLQNPANGQSGSGDIFRNAINNSTLGDDEKAAIAYSFNEDLSAAREQSQYEATEKANRAERFDQYKAETSDITGAAKQALLQGESLSTVHSMVIEDRSSSATVDQATEILKEAKTELAELVADTKTTQLEFNPFSSDTLVDDKKISKAYQDTLEDSGVSSETAKKASADLTEGKGGKESASIRTAHKEVLDHAKLRDMYERVYDSLSVPSSVSQLAAKDAARGLGANTSTAISDAHNIVREATTKAEISADNNWDKYADMFKSSHLEKYPGDTSEPTPYALMKGVAKVALEDGQSKSSVTKMIENSPINNPPSGDRSTQAKGIVTSVSNSLTVKDNKKSQQKAKPKTKAKAKVTAKKVGMEM